MPKNDLTLLLPQHLCQIQAALNTKFTSLFRILQSPTFAFQVYQALRFGALLLGAASMAWFLAPATDMDRFETLTLVAGSCTFFWIGGILDGFLLLNKSAAPAARPGILGAAGFMTVVLTVIAMLAAAAQAVWIEGLDLLGQGVIWFFVYWGLEMVTQLLAYNLIAVERPRELLALALVNASGYTIAIGLPLLLDGDFHTIYMGLAGFGALKLIWAAISLRPDWGRRDFVRPLWRISWPLMLAALLSQSAVYVDGYLVQRFFPDHFLSFRYGAREFPLVLLLANSMSVVRAGEITAGLRDGQLDASLNGLRRSTDRLVWTMFPLSILLVLLSGPLFEMAFRGRFPDAVPVFDVFLLLTVPRLMFPQSLVRGYHRTWMMSLSAGVELVLNVGLSLLFMQFWGIAGIAGATVVAYLVEKLILMGYAHRILGISWRRYASVPLWLMWTLALLMAWACKYLWLS